MVQGSFEITMQGEPPYDDVAGVTLSRATFSKRFSGPLEATSTVHMLAARTPVAASAGYVAVERISGALEGRAGTFVVTHVGIMTRGQRSLTVQIVPDSGTGALAGIAGTMDIEVTDGKHVYTLDYRLDPA
jgi:hypothetical protein